jgi:hypothetical protein
VWSKTIPTCAGVKPAWKRSPGHAGETPGFSCLNLLVRARIQFSSTTRWGSGSPSRPGRGAWPSRHGCRCCGNACSAPLRLFHVMASQGVDDGTAADSADGRGFVVPATDARPRSKSFKKTLRNCGTRVLPASGTAIMRMPSGRLRPLLLGKYTRGDRATMPRPCAVASWPNRGCPGQQGQLAVKPGVLRPGADLRHPPHAHQHVTAGSGGPASGSGPWQGPRPAMSRRFSLRELSADH